MARKKYPVAPPRFPVTFRVGVHLLKISGGAGVWTFAVDERASTDSFATEAEAWEAGVREADRIDRPRPS